MGKTLNLLIPYHIKIIPEIEINNLLQRSVIKNRKSTDLKTHIKR